LTQVTSFAPAKINLTLHVTGRRTDGYHLLDSLVVFVDVGDRITVTAGDQFRVTGPRAAGVPIDSDNLVLKAAVLMRAGAVQLTLDKHLPAASGIGGGSADAAATLRAIGTLRDLALPSAADQLALGADVPVCVASKACRMAGIGEIITPLAPLPPVYFILANAGCEVPTPDVFRALKDRNNSAMPRELPVWKSAESMIAWLSTQRNDLEPPACSIAPEIASTLRALADLSGCGLARMSGSGATCFGLFADASASQTGAAKLQKNHPNWWVTAAGFYTNGVELS
jgi:4-diphosphocytidyl-2-C-methyl-D-erythritol kinase